MNLILKVLRGVGLVAMDNNLVSADSSDPYCEVYVNGKKIVWTPEWYNTLNQVWGGPMSMFKVVAPR
jgi:Ca2+-dependent lipid-binding protein